MSELVSSRGWSLLYCQTEHAGALSAAILKDGVVATYTAFRGEADYTVTLQHPAHPKVKLHDYSPPTISKIFEDYGLSCNAPTCLLTVIDQNLGEIKQYLTDEVIFRRDVEEAAKSTVEKYRAWVSGPSFTRKLARGLAEQHPWLVTGRTPTLSELTWTERSFFRSAQFRNTVVVGAVRLSLLLYRYLP
ncbi:hypothetical protein ACU5AX_07515 [Sphingomonas sp. XXL09]|uniref:hypothetical protein n=1 Tax=Sphingomonas sp. XXL09 TaxID=3457787 RepID=UPI00406BC657